MMQKPSYNVYSSMPLIPYSIIRKLACSNNEDFWKALYYDDYDCFSKPNLTFEEKVNLIWKNEADEEKFKIFLKPLIASEITKASTQLRINKIALKPNTQYIGTALYEFAIVTGYNIAMINFNGIPISRVDYLEQQLLEELNGKELGEQNNYSLKGATLLQFNKELDRETQSRQAISNSKTFFGTTMIMGINISNLRGNTCG